MIHASKKKWLAGLISLVMLLTLLAGCTKAGNGGTTSPAPGSGGVYSDNGLPMDEKVTLTFGFWENGYGREWIDNAIAKFTAKYPNVKFEVTYSPKIGDLISTKIAAKNDNDMFDIISPQLSSADEKILVQKAGLFEDLSDLWTREVPDAKGKKLQDLVLDGTKEFAAKVDGKYYEIPMGGYTTGLFYDKAFFKQNGWNQNPQTYAEFLKLMDDIKAKGIIPITYPGKYPGYATYPFTIKQFELAERKGTLDAFIKNYRAAALPIYSSDESKEAWTRMYEMGKKGYFPEGLAALSHTQSQMQLLQHKAALASTGDWVQNEMKTATPDGFEWGFMAIPFGDKASDTIWVQNGIGSGSVMIWKNKPEIKKQWAKEFNMFLMTNEIQAFNNKFAGIYPIRKDFLDNPKNLEEMQAAPKAVMEYAQKNKVRYGTINKEITFSHPSAAKATKLIEEMTGEVALGKKDPVPVLIEADKLMKEAIDAEKK